MGGTPAAARKVGVRSRVLTGHVTTVSAGSRARPAHEKRNADAAFEERSLGAVEGAMARRVLSDFDRGHVLGVVFRRPVVAEENEEGVSRQTGLRKPRHDLTDRFIDARDHGAGGAAVDVLDVLVGLENARRHLERLIRRVIREIKEEKMLVTLPEKLERFAGEDIDQIFLQSERDHLIALVAEKRVPSISGAWESLPPRK